MKQKLINEVRGAFTRDEDINFIDASNLKYMLAVLNEALRLFPIVPVGLPRIVPKGGETVNGKWVPAGVCSDYSSGSYLNTFIYIVFPSI